MGPTPPHMPSVLSADLARRGHLVRAQPWALRALPSPAASSCPSGPARANPFLTLQANVPAAPPPLHLPSWVYFTRSARISPPPLLSLLPALLFY